MATTVVSLGYPAGSTIWKETAIGATVLIVKSTTGTLFAIDVENTGAMATVNYLKLFDLATAVTLGTTAPDDVFKIPAATRLHLHLEAAGSKVGRTFTNGLQVACVTTGGTGGVTAPTTSVILHLIYS
jgi:hypothetical protein